MILFLLKKNETYGFFSNTRRSAGLWNSTQFIVQALNKRGVDASISELVDSNDIDREVTLHKPDIVILEAIWNTPDKMKELIRLHPKIKWFCHLHSATPFLALEGVAISWIIEYAKLGIGLIANSVASFHALRVIFNKDAIIYLPNVYISNPMKPLRKDGHPWNFSFIGIGCFGAVRPLKNQLTQALAAIQFAKETRKFLQFHMNVTRMETGGDPVIKNIRALFNETPRTQLVECDWMEPASFLEYLHDCIDIGMQVSLTETFNVVTADYVTAGIPVVTSKEVTWVSGQSKALDDSVDDIVVHMHRAYNWRWLIKRNQCLLQRHSKDAQEKWFKFVKSQES